MATPRKSRSKTKTKKPRRKPETLRIRAVSASLTVNDIEASLAWYRDVMKFVVEDTWEQSGKIQGVGLKAGNTRLVINQDDWGRGRDRAKGEGFRLYLSTTQDIDMLAAGIKARGGTLASEPADMPWGTRAFSIVDPDGFKLTIASHA